MENTFDNTLKTMHDHCAMNEVTPLFVADCGSHAWGFAHPKSDWDVKFLYVHDDKDLYTSLREPTQHFTFKDEESNAEYTGYDVKKFLNLLLKGNANVYEMVASQYLNTICGGSASLGTRNLRDFVLDVLNENQDKVLSHYAGLSFSTYKQRISGVGEPTNKKWLYVLRPLMCCQYLLNEGELPPLDFFALLNATYLKGVSQDVYEATHFLLRERKSGVESHLDVATTQVLDVWAKEKLDFWANYLKTAKESGILMEKTLTNPDLFDILYRQLLDGDFKYARGMYEPDENDMSMFRIAK